MSTGHAERAPRHHAERGDGSKIRRYSRLVLLVVFALLLSISARPAHAQGCAMCTEGAKAASTGGQKALSRAVMVLLIPPVGMLAGFVGFAFRYRNRQDETESEAHLYRGRF